MRRAAANASLRAARGVVPACASSPIGRDDVAAAALDGGDDADRLLLVFQPRALLDMGLDIAVEREAGLAVAQRRGRGLQRLGQRVLQHDALPVLHLQHLVEIVVAGEHRRAHGAGLEARAFLVGPGDGHRRDAASSRRHPPALPAPRRRRARRTCRRSGRRSAGCPCASRSAPAAPSASVPSRRTKRLPMASVKIEKPRALAQVPSRLRAAASSAESACRLTPPFGVPPSFAMSACRCHRRSSRTASATRLSAMTSPQACRASYSRAHSRSSIACARRQSPGASCTIISTAT